MKYGCHNRAPYKEPHRMSPNCEYTKTDLGKVDARCVGCKWREQNELAIPDTSTNTVDVEADQGVREATARQDAGGSAVSIKAMKLALEALEDVIMQVKCYEQGTTAIDALRQAIEQAQKHDHKAQASNGLRDAMNRSMDIARQAQKQEPVAWLTKTGSVWKTKMDDTDTPLYKQTPQRQPLTDEQITDAFFKTETEMDNSFGNFQDGVRYAEAAHGITGEQK